MTQRFCWFLLAFCLLGFRSNKVYGFLGYTEAACGSNQIHCRSLSQCVHLQHVCMNNGYQCSDGSDEDPDICSVWTYNNQGYCSGGTIYCNGCTSFKDFCNRHECLSLLPSGSRICEFVKDNKLELRRVEKPVEEPVEEPGLALTEELVHLMQQSVNSSSQSVSSCPMFYNKVGKACLSLFAPAKIPWAEARQFCLSIGGDLVRIGEKITQTQLLQYMSSTSLTSSYWIGGRYDMDTNSWAWVDDDTPMPLGSPYWATRYNSSCIPRPPVHTNPCTAPPSAVAGAPCYHYTQSPLNRDPGWCAAMTYEFFYYYTDEVCQENKSPLCIYSRDISSP